MFLFSLVFVGWVVSRFCETFSCFTEILVWSVGFYSSSWMGCFTFL